MQPLTAFSGRRGRAVRAGAALLATALTAGGTTVLGAAPATAWGVDQPGASVVLSARTTTELTDGNNHIRALGAADKVTSADGVVLSFPLRSGARGASGDQVVSLAGGIAYTGAGPDVTWTRLRVDFTTNRITARVDGGDRVAVLGTDDHDVMRAASWVGDHNVLRLTPAGARSLNRAAAGAPFHTGDVFAADSTGCS